MWARKFLEEFSAQNVEEISCRGYENGGGKYYFMQFLQVTHNVIMV
jgi:hypothetical protein